MTADPQAVLVGLTHEMRASVSRLRRGPKWLGGQPPAIPKGTATALRRRGLVESVDGTGRIQLTDLGRRVATAHLRDRLPKSPVPDGHIRLDATLPAPAHERYGEGCLDDQLGETVTIRKDVGGSYTGRLIAATIVDDGAAVRLTLDVPTAAYDA